MFLLAGGALNRSIRKAIRLDRCVGMAGVNGPACVLLAGPLPLAWSARGGKGWMPCGRCGGSGPTMTVLP